MRITQIHLNDFRAFPGPQSYIIDLGSTGKNLLLYGENGSGKSSLFHAITEFFNLDPSAFRFRAFKNEFSGDESRSHVTGLVSLQFTNGAVNEWNYFGSRPTHDPFIVDGSLRKALLDYRALLKTSFVDGQLENRLFLLACEVLLRNVPVTLPGGSEKSLGSYWDEVIASRPRYRYAPHVRRAERAANDFNTALRATLPGIQTEVERLLAYFNDPWLSVEFDFRGIRFDKGSRNFLDQMLGLKVAYQGLDLPNHVQFLNEARLSALALALYFASARLSNPTPPPEVAEPMKLLVLDDVLIGLDMSHRIPVLELLEKEFLEEGWQVMLFTYDRNWYEVAKQRLRDGTWAHYEVYASRFAHYEKPLLIPDDDHLYRALSFVELGQVKAAAIHVRTKFEMILKRACHELRLPVRYQLDLQRIPASDFWASLKSAEVKTAPALQYARDSKGRLHWWQPKPSKQRVVPIELQMRIEHAVSWLLNPLAHSENVVPYRAEIEDAIYAVDELASAVQQALSFRDAKPQAVWQMLLSILHLRVKQLESESLVSTPSPLTNVPLP